MQDSLKPFFSPDGVAIIGASSKTNKLSYGILRNLTLYGYKGAIYPVNPGSEEILGKKCYPDIRSVPDPVDLAVIVLPANLVLEAVINCAKRGIKAITLISGGFKELGTEGEELEKQLISIIRKNDMRMVGPNCVGTMSLHNGLNTTFISGIPDIGGIGFLSQSGAVLGGIVDLVKGKGVGFAHFSSLGNEADVTETDMIDYLGNDPQTTVIAAYVEQIQDGTSFIKTAKKVSETKPIVLLKAGKTSAGARAVSSHTGSLAGLHSAYQAAFIQSGVIEVQSVNDLFDVSQAFALQHLPKGRRVVILTNSGGPAALASDSLATNGLIMADLSNETTKELRNYLNKSAQVNNPVDMLGGAEALDFENAMKVVIDDPNVDIIVAILVPQSLVNPVEVAHSIYKIANLTEKTVIACFMGDQLVAEPRRVLHANHVPMFVYPESVGNVLGAMLRYANWKSSYEEIKPITENINYEMTRRIFTKYRAEMSLGEALTRPILESYGISVIKGEIAKSAQEAAIVAQKIGFPVALKIISKDILHKSDVGGIRLNIFDTEQVLDGFQIMMADIHNLMPHTEIDGVIVEKMAPKGQEVIVGMRRDPGFGPVIMFGLGGIYVELFKDVAFRVAPISKNDAMDIVFSTKAGTLLRGFRGAKESDIESVVDILMRLSQLSCDFPEISEIEINPLLVLPKGEGSIALDGRVILDSSFL
ncbi:MAG: acyl-CoA synthetase [Chloroflexi bacterium HGW-Chloroflexi-8]|nr:MAG: acyl-CoA synthetase [Chloroflexi bacterium HGW-Chloroflexi-8]